MSAKESPKKETANEDAALVIPQATEVPQPEDAQLLDETDLAEDTLTTPAKQ